jgi:hypothetical protein
MSDCTDGFLALSEAEPGYKEAHAYYSGEVAEVFTSPSLKRVLRKSGDRFKMNVIKSVPDAVADRLEIMSARVTAEAGDPKVGTSPVEKPSASPAQVALDRIIEANALDFEMPAVFHRVSEFGDAFMMVWPAEVESESEVEGEEDEEADEGVVVNYLSPLTCRIVYDRDNPRVKRYAVHCWQESRPGNQKVYRMNLLYPDRVERWVTKVGAKPEAEGGWEPSPSNEDDPDSWTAENPYGRVPVFHFRNGTPYGTPEHLNGYGAQDAVNKIVIAHMSTIDFHIAPQRYALADGTDDDDDADEFDIGADLDDAEEPKSVEEREARKALKSGAGEVWWLKGVKSVGQFEAADADTFTKPASFYLRMMAQMTKTPLDMLDDSGDEPSGESRRRKDAPLTNKVRDRQRMYGATVEDMYAFALEVAGFPGKRVVVHFAPAEVVSDAEGWATIKAKIEAGVPVRQALAEAGYTTEQIDQWFPEGEENNLRVADLVAVSDVLQKLGAAVALDILSAEEARNLLPEGVLPESALGEEEPTEELPTPPAFQSVGLPALVEAGIVTLEEARELLGITEALGRSAPDAPDAAPDAPVVEA